MPSLRSLEEGEVLKPLAYENLLKLTEDELQANFPFGAAQNKDSRWRPAEEGKAEISLKELLRRKRKLVEPRRLLGKTGGYVENPAFALYTNPDPGEAVAEGVQEQFSKEGRERHDALLELFRPTEPLVYIRRRRERKAA